MERERQGEYREDATGWRGPVVGREEGFFSVGGAGRLGKMGKLEERKGLGSEEEGRWI
jgi:hypothetical protein